MDDAARPIDKIDRRILRVLQADGCISNLKLAEGIGVLTALIKTQLWSEDTTAAE